MGLNEIYNIINSDETEYLEIIHNRQHDSTVGFWYIKTSMFGEKKEIDNPTNLCIYDDSRK